MAEDVEGGMEWAKRDRLLARVDHMVELGRLTEGEAQRLRAAADARQFDDAVRAIRVRHATATLHARVADGSLTRADADELLERLGRGEHGHSIRAHLRTRHDAGGSGLPDSDPEPHRPGSE